VVDFFLAYHHFFVMGHGCEQVDGTAIGLQRAAQCLAVHRNAVEATRWAFGRDGGLRHAVTAAAGVTVTAVSVPAGVTVPAGVAVVRSGGVLAGSLGAAPLTLVGDQLGEGVADHPIEGVPVGVSQCALDRRQRRSDPFAGARADPQAETAAKIV
jgi:hypothetical protein